MSDTDDDGCVEVDAKTYRNLQAIAQILVCDVETALKRVVSEYVVPQPSTSPEYLSPSQAARILCLSSSRVVQLEREGRLAAIHTPNGRLFPEEEVRTLAALRAAKGAK